MTGQATRAVEAPLEAPVRPLAARVLYLDRMRYTAATKAAELRREAELLERDAGMAALLLAEARAGACKCCHGFGKVTVQYAQDDIKTETCDRCNGGGAA